MHATQLSVRTAVSAEAGVACATSPSFPIRSREYKAPSNQLRLSDGSRLPLFQLSAKVNGDAEGPMPGADEQDIGATLMI
ncbi:hypothetical protein MTO96_004702 [Rhipicephalus appendiculatus]